MGMFDFLDPYGGREGEALEQFKMGQLAAKHPEILKQHMAQQQQQQRQTYMNDLMGNKATPANYTSQTQHTEGPVRPGESRPIQTINQLQDGFSQAEDAVEGSGFLGGDMGSQELAMRLMAAPTKETATTGGSLINQLLKPPTQTKPRAETAIEFYQRDPSGYGNMQASQNAPGSPQPTASMQNHRFYRQLDDNQKNVWDRQNKVGNKWLNQGNQFYNPSSNRVMPINLAQNETPQYKADVKTSEGYASANVKTDIEQQEQARTARTVLPEARNALDIARTIDKGSLGPVASMFPSFSSSAQRLESSLENLIPSAKAKMGPMGPLSDSDIAMLKTMVPNMRMNRDVLVKKLEKFNSALNGMISRDEKRRQRGDAPQQRAPSIPTMPPLPEGFR